MKRKILNGSLAAVMIGSQFSPIIAAAAETNSSARWGVHSGITQMSQTYPFPTEAYEDLMKNAYGQASENSIYHRVMDLTQSLTDVAKSTLSTTLSSEGIVFNSSQTQAEVTSNLTWYGDDWSDQARDDSGDTYPDYRKSLLKSDLTGNSFEVKEYATYFNTATGETELLDMEVTVSYNDTTRLRSTGGVDVIVRPAGITWNKGGTDELVVETTFYKTGTSTVVNAPVMYHFTDFDNGGTIGVDNRQVYGVWTYLPTTTGAWADVYNTYHEAGNVFNFKVFFDQLTTAEQGIGVCSRYFTDTDRTKFQNIGNFGSLPSGNLTPSERGSGRIKFVNKGNYTAILDGWSTNTGDNSSTQDCTMTTNGQDGELVIVMDSTATITMSQMAAVVNYGIEDGSGDTLMMKPYNYQAIVSANLDAEGDEGVVRTDSELLELMDVTYNTPTGYDISVDQSAIDYNTPGTYEVKFTNEADESTFTTTGLYTVNNVAPVIEGNDLVTVEIDSVEETDFTTLFGLSSIDGTEVTTEDLTFEWKDEEPLVVDGKYAMTGDYTIVVTSKDDEGYDDVTKEVTLSIKRDVDQDTTATEVGVGTIAPEVTGDSTASDNEYTTHTDAELIEMFNIVANDDEYGWRSLSVDQSAIDYTTPGTYDVVFTVTENISKETATFTGIYEVADVLPTITADDLVEVKLNDEEINYQAMFNVVASEITEGDLNLDVTVTPDENILLNESYNTYIMTGSFDITFTVEDNEGNVASTTSTLKVSRDFESEYEAMVSEVEVIGLELTANETASGNEGDVKTDEELKTAFEVVSNEDSEGIRTLTVDQSAIDYDTPGTYDVVFTITESISGETVTVTSQYEVLDVLPTIESTESIDVLLNSEAFNYVEGFEVIATEFASNDLIDSVTVDGVENLPINEETNTFNVTGAYDLVFTATDSDGNTVSTTSTLNIKRDMSIEGEAVESTEDVLPLELTANETYSENEHTSHTDEELLELFNVVGNDDTIGFRTITVDQSAVDYETPGTYDVVFTITESISGDTLTVTSQYEVIDVLPTIESTESVDVLLNAEVFDFVEGFSVIASEFEESDLIDSIAIDGIENLPINEETNTFNVTGAYDLVFTATDSDGNTVSTTSTLNIKRDMSIEGEAVESNSDVLALELTANETASGNEHIAQTDEELLELFNVVGNDDTIGFRTITVDQSAIDYETPGTYDVVFTITEAISKETLTVTSQYEVIDVLPTIESTDSIDVLLNSEAFNYVEDFEVIASEFESNDLIDSVTVDGVENLPINEETNTFNVTGAYDLVFTATDSDGNTVSTTSTLNIKRDMSIEGEAVESTEDVIPLELTANETYSENEHTSHTDEELLELFNVVGNDDIFGFRKITVDQSAVDYETPGTYDVVFTITEAISKETLTVTSQYEVIDVLPTIESTESVDVLLSSEVFDFIEGFEVIASEFEESDLIDSIAIDGVEDLPINEETNTFNVTGAYDLVFTATDSDGNTVSTTSTLNIKRDMSIEGEAVENTEGVLPLELSANSTYAENEHTSHTDEELLELFNVVGNDDIFGFRTITVDQSAVDYETPGTYDVVFTITESISKETLTITSQYEVIDVLPTIESTDSIDVLLNSEAFNYVEDFEVIASEFENNDLIDSVTVDGVENLPINEETNTFNVTGAYDLVFTATDSDGNTVSTTSTLNIKRDMSIEGEAVESNSNVIPLELTANETYSENEHTSHTDEELLELFNVVGNDDELGFRTITVDQSAVDYETPGTYDVVFTITEAISKETLTVTSQYEVIDVLPTIESTDNVNVLLNSETFNYIEGFEVIASEFESNDLIDSVTVDGVENLPIDEETNTFNVTGAYDLVFTATDSDGNTVSKAATLNIKRDMSIEGEAVESTEDVLPLELTANETYSENEHTSHTDEELLELFNVVGNDDIFGFRKITVDQSAVDYETPGTYDVVFTITEAISKETLTVTSQYEVIDVLPTIATTDVEVLLGSDEVDYLTLVNATEFEENDLIDTVTIEGIEPHVTDGKYDVTGSYELLATATDSDGNKVSETLTITIKRDMSIEGEAVESNSNVIPLELSSNETASGNEHTSYTDEELLELFDVVANNDDLGYRTLTIDSSNIDFDTPGIYSVTFAITESISGEMLTVTSQYEVIDVLPTIESLDTAVLLGSEEIDYINEMNVTATELAAGDLNDVVEVTVDAPLDEEGNYNVTGLYNVEFTTADDEGNEVTSRNTLTVYRDINVDADAVDNNAAVVGLELTADEYFADNQGVEYTDADLLDLFNVVGNDDEYGFRTITVDQSAVDYTTPGTYDVVFTITEAISGETLTVTSQYEVIDVLPTMTLGKRILLTSAVSEENITSKEAELIQMLNITATELATGDINDSIVLSSNELDLTTPGNYEIFVTGQDAQGNEVTELAIIYVLDGKQTGQEHNTLTIDELFTVFNLNLDSEYITVTEEIDYSTPGDYDVTVDYAIPTSHILTSPDFEISEEAIEVINNSNTIGTEIEDADELVTGTVNYIYTVEDILPTIDGDEQATINVNENVDYTDLFNVVASEIEEDDLKDSVVVDSSNVDVTTAGTYNVLFTVQDDENNVVSHEAELNVSEEVVSTTNTDEEADMDIENTEDASAEDVLDNEVEDSVKLLNNYTPMELVSTGAVISTTLLVIAATAAIILNKRGK